MKTEILDYLADRVLVIDGAMGTAIQEAALTIDDFAGLENCSEILLETRPDLIRSIHDSFLEVGCRAVETNTFGANKIVLEEFERCDLWAGRGGPRFVLGSVGPGTKLPTLGHTTFDTLEDSYAEQVRGLVDGGADAILIETCQDLVQAKAAISGANLAFAGRGRLLPIFCQVTMETTGTMLVGSDISAALAALEPFSEVEVIGLNCATGPQEMSEHVAYLGKWCPRRVSVVPNAGLPQLAGGRTHYPLTPSELAHWILRFVEEDGVAMVGGCCGTKPAHLAAVVAALGERRPRPREVSFPPSISSIYSAQTLQQETSYFIIGERTNTNGSRKFRQLLEKESWDGLVAMGRELEREGCHAVDLCVAHVDRASEGADMEEVLKRFVTQIKVPIVIDTTEAPVLERALKLCGGRAICNSINLEDGEEKLDRRVEVCKKFGAACIALTIDEQGMAKEADDKLRIARRIFDICTRRHGLRPGDLIFDPLTFTICTGNEADRRLGMETLEGIRRIKEALPGVFTVLGLSNVSFGLKPNPRHVLNSVFLHHAREAGLDAAIVHAEKIKPLFKIDERLRQVAEDLIFDRRRDGYDPLQEFLGLFGDESAPAERAGRAPATVEEKLKARIIDGDRPGLEADLDEALEKHPPLEIINDILLDGMRVVGELFGSGQMQLPFVLQSAETMKAAVGHLEKFLEKVEGVSKGRIVLATVKGDVHDIGKNLVDIILTNNGYTVFNLGIKQPITAILEKARAVEAHAIGLSGLLVKSTVVMRENLEELDRQEVRMAVILGGAALSRRYVEVDCRKTYQGRVEYGKDAFEGLALMDSIVRGEPERRSSYPGARGFAPRGPGETADTRKAAAREAGETEPAAAAAAAALIPPAPSRAAPLAGSAPRGRPDRFERGSEAKGAQLPAAAEVRRDIAVPVPPFFGPRPVERIEVEALLPFINEEFLFRFQWQFKQRGASTAEYRKFLEREVRPIYLDLVARALREEILEPKAIYGYFPCQSEGDDLIVYSPGGSEVLHRFVFPRQRKGKRLCIADFFRPRSSGEMDVIGMTIVTVGARVSEVERRWFAESRYQDYLFLHGFGVEASEALAELIHKQMRAEMGIAGDDARNIEELFRQGYRGSRYSFGYPACPNLEDQVPQLRILGAERIGVTISEEFQLEPEQSTSALVVHHPQAKYFNV
jgi:5-methyltetrahydrofolate--homocysteine methyltransferase